MSNPRQYKIPDWFLNRQKDIKDGKTGQMMSNVLDNKLREDLERLKKIRAHRGLRHYWGVLSVVNTPRRQVAEEERLVYPKRSKEITSKGLKIFFTRSSFHLLCICYTIICIY